MTKNAALAKYEAPRLTAYGSVRNLTGGSAQGGADAILTRTPGAPQN